MSNDRINIVGFCVLSLVLVTNAGQPSESKVIQVLRDELQNIKCFSETLRDLTCVWEEERNDSYLHPHSFSFTYQYQNENSSACAVSELPVQGAGGKRLFVCNIPKTQSFVPLQLRVFQEGRELYNRSLLIDHAVLLNPPANLTVVSTGNQGELIVSWLPPALKYFDDSYMYEIRYEAKGNPMRKEIVTTSTKLTLSGLQPGSKYKVMVRVKPDGITYDGYWSAWSDPEFGTTAPSDPLIVVLIIISLILLLLSFTMLLSHHRFLLKKLWPDIPSPEHKFPGLFTIYEGDFQEWLGQGSGSRWSVHVYTEELPSSLEVLSEVSLTPPLTSHTSPLRQDATPRAADFLREEPQAVEAADDQLATQKEDVELTDSWQEPPHNHWLMEQLRAFQKHPEVLSHSSLLESQDTYVTLNQHSQCAQGEVQRNDSLEESLPLQVLFASKGSSLMAASDSDIGSLSQSSASGRLSSQSSLEYPNHTWPPRVPGYTCMAVADSGVSMDYSPMSFSRMTDKRNGTIYANEYKNDIPGHKRQHTGQPIHYGY